MRKGPLAVLVGIGFVLLFANPVASDTPPKGNLIGFLYATDGSTPLQGAVVRIKNIQTDEVLLSQETDELGITRIADIEPGLYIYGVTTKEGDFNSTDLVGVASGKTAKVSITLEEYSEREAEAVKQIARDLSLEGESLIGRVEEFCSSTRTADIFMIKGLLRKNDRIHVVGDKTDIYQTAKNLRKDGKPAKKVLAAETATLSLSQTVHAGDLVYMVSRKGLAPLFLSPLGIVSAVAGSGAVVYGITQFSDTKESSRFR